MKRSSMLSRAFFRRPTIRELVPDLKLVLAVLVVGCESHVGVYRPSGLGEDSGLDAQALAGALDDLEHRGHIVRDGNTGELFIASFFRDNTFLTPARRGQARDDFAQIESQLLCNNVLRAIAQNQSCGLLPIDVSKNHIVNAQGQGQGEREGKAVAAPRAETRELSGAAATIKSGKVRAVRPSGIVTWCADDPSAAKEIEEQHDGAAIHAAVLAISATGKDPVPGLVSREIERQRRDHEASKRRAEAEAAHKARLVSQPNVDKDTMQRGAEFLARVMRARENPADSTRIYDHDKY